MSNKLPILAVVVPCYNEEEVLLETTNRLTSIFGQLLSSSLIASDSYILYVNDGSKDNTWSIISNLYKSNRFVCGVNLAGNVGHQNALIAGLDVAKIKADIMITIDADLQDDVNAIIEMVARYHEGFDVVYGVRKSRKTDTWFKRNSALAFYSIMKGMGVKSVYNHADFRLLSKRAVQYLLQFKERNIFLRGIVPLIGYNTCNVYYDRNERFAGESKYPLKKMVSFALDGITSFSVKPLHLVLYLGFLFLFVAFMIFIWVMKSYLSGMVVAGWTSVILSIWFCSGCVLLGIGIMGEYVGKIYVEAKGRPRYNIETILVDKKSNDELSNL